VAGGDASIGAAGTLLPADVSAAAPEGAAAFLYVAAPPLTLKRIAGTRNGFFVELSRRRRTADPHSRFGTSPDDLILRAIGPPVARAHSATLAVWAATIPTESHGLGWRFQLQAGA
jgi:hypothetical protein